MMESIDQKYRNSSFLVKLTSIKNQTALINAKKIKVKKIKQ